MRSVCFVNAVAGTRVSAASPREERVLVLTRRHCPLFVPLVEFDNTLEVLDRTGTKRFDEAWDADILKLPNFSEFD